jgi:hypothetical protein
MKLAVLSEAFGKQQKVPPGCGGGLKSGGPSHLVGELPDRKYGPYTFKAVIGDPRNPTWHYDLDSKRFYVVDYMPLKKDLAFHVDDDFGRTDPADKANQEAEDDARKYAEEVLKVVPRDVLVYPTSGYTLRITDSGYTVRIIDDQNPTWSGPKAYYTVSIKLKL